MTNSNNTQLAIVKRDLVLANHILASEGVVDSFGHVSARHPVKADRYLLSRAISPEQVTVDDIMEFSLDGVPTDGRTDSPYFERFIHGAVYEARGDVRAVVHNHSHNVIPFGVTGETLRPLFGPAAILGEQVPVWDSRDNFGDTNLLVANMEMGRDLARSVSGKTAALMRGHGCVVVGASIKLAVFASVYLEVNAELQIKASRIGNIKFLSAGEIDRIQPVIDSAADRAWDNWQKRVTRLH